MNETQVKMMQEYGVLVLPEDVDREAYELVVEALLLADSLGHEQVVLYCAGMGGDVNAALAMVDLLQHRGNVIGLLPGQADSSHATVWLGCSERYVFPMGSMGIHGVKFVYNDGVNVDERFAHNYLEDVKSYNQRTAKLLGSACDYHHNESWWLETLADIGSVGIRHYSSGKLVKMGIARMSSEFVMPSRDDADRASPVPTDVLMNYQHGMRVRLQNGGSFNLAAPATQYRVMNPDGKLYELVDQHDGTFIVGDLVKGGDAE